jgi:LPXTG-motif cell wall-anchored protein
MSQGKVLGPTVAVGAAAATLPVTGNSVLSAVLIGSGLLVGGMLLIRAARHRQTEA